MIRNTFDWSLKPLTLWMRFNLGCNLNVSKRTNNAVRFTVPLLGFFYFFFNLVVNGPCGLFSESAKFDETKKNRIENQFGINLMTKREIVLLFSDVIKFSTFLSVSLIHLIFMSNVFLTSCWNDFWSILQRIQRKMKLDEEFHRKVRRHCLVGILLLILVR